VFNPPPKVKSGVIRCTRNERTSLPCSDELFKTVVKTTFNQRRKTIRNTIKPLIAHLPDERREQIRSNSLMDLRPEVLSIDQFIELTLLIEGS
jgi:16S rRNA (adenine1518-N6/adenine1519-N6)-dimethyltransferase